MGRPVSEFGARHQRDLLVGELLLGDVAEEPDAAEIFHFWIVQRAGMPVDDAAVGELDLLVTLDLRMLVEIVDAGEELVLVLHLRGHGIEQWRIATDPQQRRWHLPQFGEMPVVHDDVAAGVDDEDAVRRAFDRRGQQDAGEGLLFLGPLALGDVGEDAFDGDQAAAGVAHQAAVAVEPGDRAVGLQQPEFAVGDCALAGEQRANLLLDGGQVLRRDERGPALRVGQQRAGVIAVVVDVLRQIDQRERRLRVQPVEYCRTVLNDAVGVGQALEVRSALDRRTDQFGHGLDDVDLDRGPVALAAAIVEADHAEPFALGEHRYREDRLDAGTLEHRPRRRLQLTHVADHRFAVPESLDPRLQADRLHGALGDVAKFERLLPAGRGPQIMLQDAAVRPRGVDQEEMGAVDAGGAADLGGDLGQRYREVGRAQQFLGRHRHRFEQPVAALPVEDGKRAAEHVAVRGIGRQARLRRLDFT